MKLRRRILQRYLHYDLINGVWKWRKRIGNRRAGSVAGNIMKAGHRQITIFGVTYMAHQLAWFYVKGRWAKSDIDHEDGIPDNNSWTNLRRATASQNIANSKIRKDNKVGLKGVHQLRSTSQYQASIRHNGRKIHLGTFISAKKAHEAYCAAARKLQG